MKLKINDQVVFTHVARGSRQQIGTIIEMTKGPARKYTVRNNTNGRIYPCLTTGVGSVGKIIKKIS